MSHVVRFGLAGRARAAALGSTRAVLGASVLVLLAGCSAGAAGEESEPLGQQAQLLEGCTLTPPADVTTATCPASILVTVGEATASGCGDVEVTGEVISSNGEPLATPIPVVDGEVELGPGTHVIRWSVPGAAPVEQTVVVNAGLQSGQSFLVNDRGSVGIITGSQTGPAGLFNSGTGQVLLRQDASGGDVVSVGPVNLLDRARLLGGIVSEGAVTLAPSAVVAGPLVAFGDVSLPPLPSLPAFPPATGGSVNVNSNQSRSLAPGSYASVAVGSGGTLVLGSGDYFFQNLIANSGAVLTVASDSSTRVFVQNQLVLPGSFQGPGGLSLIPTILGYAGTSLTLSNNYIGTVVAPNADLTLGSGGPKQYIGAFYARTLQVGIDSQVLCNFLSAVGGQL